MKIALIGVGPRNLLVLHDLLKNYSKSRVDRLKIYLYDRYPIGGRVWVTNQSLLLIMDTICQQITMFPKGEGPDLYQWIKRDAKPYLKSHYYQLGRALTKMIPHVSKNDYVPHAFYGIYMQWFYRRMTADLSPNVKIKWIPHYVKNIQKKSGGYSVVAENSERTLVDRIVMSLGQTVNRTTNQEHYFHRYAIRHHILYSPIGYTQERNLAPFRPQAPVIVRGLGLNFYDVMHEMTIGRGGHFIKLSNGLLSYHPSGREPRMIAGSRTGLPYCCKANNQKANWQYPQPYFISKASVDQHLVNHKLPYRDFMRLLVLDMELQYYDKLIRSHSGDRTAAKFRRDFTQSQDHLQVINRYRIPSTERFSLMKIMHPIDPSRVTSVSAYQGQVARLLKIRTLHALRGNETDPLIAAIEVLRDSRDNIRYLVNHHYFTKKDYYEKFLGNFNRINSNLVMGGPVTDTNRLRALINARVVTVLPGDMVVKTHRQRRFLRKSRYYFVAYSNRFPNDKVFAKGMIEARNPTPDLSLAVGTLTNNLINSGILSERQAVLSSEKMITLDNVNVDPDTDQMIDYHGRIERNLYAWGIGTEGIHWCTPNSPHASGHDSNLRAADRIAKDLLGIPHREFNLM